MTRRIALFVVLLATASFTAVGAQEHALPVSLEVFSRSPIGFVEAGPDPETYPGAVTTADRGRVIVRTVVLPEVNGSVEITAKVSVFPVPRDELEVYDKWDRAGNVRLVVDGHPDVELLKFITPYGGTSTYEVDVSHLAPLLRGTRTFKAFIDTWVNPAWTISLALSYDASADTLHPVWTAPLAYEEAATADRMASEGIQGEVDVPPGLSRVLMYYYVSGHCTDGRDADEFVSKDNVLSVDGRVVYRYRPWRADCRDFRDRNPYCRRWSDGSWSCDYPRSGWCPGDVVPPLVLDLTDHFPAGRHRVQIDIEQIRPRDAEGHYGYWRVSGHLAGYR